MMTLSLRLNEEEALLIKKCAELNRLSVSEFVRQAVMEKIEDEYDLAAFDAALEEYRKNPVTISHEDVAALLDLD